MDKEKELVEIIKVSVERYRNVIQDNIEIFNRIVRDVSKFLIEKKINLTHIEKIVFLSQLKLFINYGLKPRFLFITPNDRKKIIYILLLKNLIMKDSRVKDKIKNIKLLMKDKYFNIVYLNSIKLKVKTDYMFKLGVVMLLSLLKSEAYNKK